MNSDSLNMVSRLGEGHMPWSFFLSEPQLKTTVSGICRYLLLFNRNKRKIHNVDITEGASDQFLTWIFNFGPYGQLRAVIMNYCLLLVMDFGFFMFSWAKQYFIFSLKTKKTYKHKKEQGSTVNKKQHANLFILHIFKTSNGICETFWPK